MKKLLVSLFMTLALCLMLAASALLKPDMRWALAALLRRLYFAAVSLWPQGKRSATEDPRKQHMMKRVP